MNLNLKDKTIVVSGSSRGIGKAIAEGLLKEGAVVYLTGRDEAALKQAHEEYSSAFPDRAFAFRGDLNDSRIIRDLMDVVIGRHGRLDVSVANIGSGRSKAGWDIDDEHWAEGMDMNFYPAVKLVRESIRVMVPKKSGSIVVMSSIAGCEAIPAPMPYSAAKSALLSFVKNVSNIVAEHGIRVNAVSPGNVFFKGGTWDRKLRENRTAVEEYLRGSVPMQRLGETREIADAVCFLCSERASFVTGSNFVVDGGQIRKLFE